MTVPTQALKEVLAKHFTQLAAVLSVLTAPKGVRFVLDLDIGKRF